MTQRILVTGGFGFIGGHLVELLLSYGDAHVHVVDDLSSSPLALDETLSLFPDHVGSRLTYDIETIAEFLRRAPDSSFDEIYHLASPVGPAGVLRHGGEMVRSVVDDTYRLIDVALRWRCTMLDVSTSEIYGGGQSGSCAEDGARIVPAETTIRLEYAVAKLAAETAIINKAALTELRAVIIRPFNVAGPRQSGEGGFVLPRFIGQALAGEPVTVFGDGSAIRAFTHVSDIVRGMHLAMATGSSGAAYNLGNPKNKISVLELAELVLDVTKSDSQIEFVDPREIYGERYAEASDKYPAEDLALLRKGWVPEHDVRAIVEEALSAQRVWPKLGGSANRK